MSMSVSQTLPGAAMPTVVNTHQAEAWNGYEGHHWADHPDRYDAANDGMNNPLLDAAAITESDHVLDIGCGNGRTTRLAARRASRGQVVGIDLSAPMLQRARTRAAEEGIGNIVFEQGDAQVHPFTEGGFDVAISRGGVMFFADPVAAFGNIRRALRPGGRLAVVCPRAVGAEDDFARALAPLWAAMREHGPAAKDGPGPASLADTDRIDEVLAGAGFTDITATAITVPMVFGQDSADAAEFFMAMGPMRFNLATAGTAVLHQVRSAVTDSLRGFEESGAVTLRGALWLVRAIRPALVRA
jgi:SAM-dependent methyltransferase